jgi:hypothetical protein
MPKIGEPYTANGLEHVRTPRFIFKVPGLTCAAKLVFGELAFHSWSVGCSIYPSQQQIADNLDMSIQNVRLSLALLEEKKLIRIIRPQGANKLKHFHNQYQLLWVQEAETAFKISSPDYYPASSPDYYPASSASNKLILTTNTPSEAEYVPPTASEPLQKKQKKEINPVFRRMAKQLASAISETRRVKINLAPSKLFKWATGFQLLHEKDGVDIPRIKDALDFYCDRLKLKLPYFPVIECGHTFREKISKVERAMEKEKSGNGKVEEEFRGPVVHVVRLDKEISDKDILNDY